MKQVTYKCFKCGQQISYDQPCDMWFEIKKIYCCRCKVYMTALHDCLTDEVITEEKPAEKIEVIEPKKRGRPALLKWQRS